MPCPDDWPDADDEGPLVPPADCTPREVWVTDNPIVALLYSVDGEVLLEVRERPPLGFIW